MTKNTGTDYEILTQEVFTRLHAQQQLVANVERNVVLDGKAPGTRHQIDVTFSFEAGGVSYRTIVQCKDWGSTVKQEQVLAFKQVLDEVPGQPRGIVVARSGFQDGARKLASHHGIKLYELREPRDEDWDGLIRYFDIKASLRAPQFDDVRLVLDEHTIREQVVALGLPGIEIDFSGCPSEIPVVFESGHPCDLDDILNKLVPQNGLGPVRVRHEFAERVFVEPPDSPIPRLALQAVEATIHVTEHHRNIRVSIDHLVAYAFRDVLGW